MPSAENPILSAIPIPVLKVLKTSREGTVQVGLRGAGALNGTTSAKISVIRMGNLLSVAGFGPIAGVI